MKKLNIYALSALLLSLVIVATGCSGAPTESLAPDNASSVISDAAVSDAVSTESTSQDVSEPTSDESEDESVPPTDENSTDSDPLGAIDVNNLPIYDGSPFVAINGNEPTFTPDEITEKAFERYSSLDSLGRCGVTFACVGRETMPTESRGDISSIKPSGWKNVKYDTSLVDGGYIYNRCHLLGFQLTGENANEKNLITGTRYMNVDGMLPFENMVADYVKETGNHVLLRVTPIFVGDELVARGVLMEAYSVEDEGDGVYYNVYCFNVQPGIEINYADGSSRLSGSASEDPEVTYILNTKTKKIHEVGCNSVKSIKEENRAETSKSLDELIAEGYSPCGNCKP